MGSPFLPTLSLTQLGWLLRAVLSMQWFSLPCWRLHHLHVAPPWWAHRGGGAWRWPASSWTHGLKPPPLPLTVRWVERGSPQTAGLEIPAHTESKRAFCHLAIDHGRLLIIKCQLTVPLGFASFCRQQGIENTWFIKGFASQLFEHFTVSVLTPTFRITPLFGSWSLCPQMTPELKVREEWDTHPQERDNAEKSLPARGASSGRSGFYL